MESPSTIRRAVRNYLADRPAVSQKPETIHRNLAREMEVTAPQVDQACRFLEAIDQLKGTTDPLGNERYYQITAAGTLAHERGE